MMDILCIDYWHLAKCLYWKMYQLKSSLQGSLKATSVWWSRFTRILGLTMLIYSNEFKSSLSSRENKKSKSEESGATSAMELTVLLDLENRCLNSRVESSEKTSPASDPQNNSVLRGNKGKGSDVGKWDHTSPLDSRFHTTDQQLLSSVLFNSLKFPLWNDTACTASEGMLRIPSANNTQSSTNQGTSIFGVLDAALEFFDALKVDRGRLSPKFLDARCWKDESNISSEDVNMVGVNPEEEKVASPPNFPVILEHVFKVEIFDLYEYASFLSEALSYPKFLNPPSFESCQLAIRANVGVFWALVKFSECNEEKVTVPPSDPSYISTLLKRFPRLILQSDASPRCVGAPAKTSGTRLSKAPVDVPVMMPQSLSVWSRLLVPFGPNGDTNWINRHILHEAYVLHRPKDIGDHDCRSKLLRYLSAVDLPDFGPPSLQRQIASLKVTEYEFQRSMQPTPNPEKIVRIFQLEDVPFASSSIQLFTQASRSTYFSTQCLG